MQQINILKLVNPVHLENIGKKESASVFVNSPEYKILHLKLLKLNESQLAYKSLSFLIVDNVIYKVSESQELKKLEGQYQELHQIINLQITYLSKIIDEHSAAIEKLEDRIFDRIKLANVLSEVFEHKKSLMKLGRVFDRLYHVLNFYVEQEAEYLKDYQKEYLDLVDDTGLSQRTVKSLLDKLDNIYNYYTSIKNDNLNKNIYVLSIISGVFLPLNLIVGFFGMNTPGLFLAENPQGTQVVFNTILIIFVVMLLGLPFLHLLDKLIISKLFGRYRFYKNISNRLERLNEDFNILDNR